MFVSVKPTKIVTEGSDYMNGTTMCTLNFATFINTHNMMINKKQLRPVVVFSTPNITFDIN